MNNSVSTDYGNSALSFEEFKDLVNKYKGQPRRVFIFNEYTERKVKEKIKNEEYISTPELRTIAGHKIFVERGHEGQQESVIMKENTYFRIKAIADLTGQNFWDVVSKFTGQQ